jgi:two-component system sensor histidine kinase UhpB
MSLRARVLLLVGAIFFFSTLTALLAAGYQAREALNAELVAGLEGAETTIQAALEDLPNSDHPDRDLRQLVATFNGNRHVQATLLTIDGRADHISTTDGKDEHAPIWFRPLMGALPTVQTIPIRPQIAGFGAIALEPIAELDIAVAWRQFVGVVAILTTLTTLGLVTVHLMLGAAFRPLRLLADQFGRIGQGDYSGRVREDGPVELLSLKHGFNRMASELASTTARNRSLTQQLLTIQDEERADFARDLHDEFGPHLFAVNMDAEMIVQLAEAGDTAAAGRQARSIQSAVSHMQRQVRDLLGRLRPTPATELGLNAAITDLVAFWQTRRADIAFDLALLDDEAVLAEATKDVAFRVVQEATNNAVRHGAPQAIRIAMRADSGKLLHISIDDDGKGCGQGGAGGLGLVGMGERVTAIGGTLSSGPRSSGRGWTTAATLPLVAPAPAPIMIDPA